MAHFLLLPVGSHGDIHPFVGIGAGLRARGHRVSAGIAGFNRSLFGRGQIIRRELDGSLVGGSDPRADGCAAAT